MSGPAFPRRTLRGATQIFRIHRSARSAWWFSADGSGRFDPVGTGVGACYFATDALGAWVEVFRETMLLEAGEVSERALASVRLGLDVKLADLTSRRALQFGVTASLGADREYADSHAFAVRAVETGFAGIRYLLRHDPAQKLYGIALFGPSGESGAPEQAAAFSGLIPGELVEQARVRFGYRVLPRP